MKNNFYTKYGKRGLDIICSTAALTVFSPLFLGLTVAGAIEMKGNPFFTQERPGKDEEIFKLIKFRTMTNEKDAEGNLLPDEVRLNKYGKFLRSTSLDELPEAINIFKGDMSVIGPRPWLIEYLPYFTEEEHHRHDVRPGLSGWAQVNGRNSVNWDERIQLDLYYVRNISFLLDAKIVFMSAMKFFQKGDIEVDTQKTEGNFAEIRKNEMQNEINKND